MHSHLSCGRCLRTLALRDASLENKGFPTHAYDTEKKKKLIICFLIHALLIGVFNPDSSVEAP